MRETTKTMVGDLELLETTINGHRYEMFKLEGDYSVDLLADILKMLSGPIIEAVGAMGDSSLDTDINMGKIGAALAMFPGALVAAGGSALFARILKNTTRFAPMADGRLQKQMLREPKMRDALLNAGGWEEFCDVIVWVVLENFGPFLEVMKGGFSRLSPMLKASPSATTSEA